MKTIEMEIVLAAHFNARQNLIVPNISWGLWLKDFDMLHECDLLVCTKSNYLWEVEIKVTKADLKADKKKWHCHIHRAIKRLYFAIPDNLYNCIDLIPERAGIITVTKHNESHYHCNVKRNPKQAKGYKISDKEKLKMALLGSMRIWTLKKRILKSEAR